jgi:MYXO-CTERM domain-containing protein
VGDILHALTGWLAAHTYVVAFLATAIDGTGLPFPGRLILMAAGALAASVDDVSVLAVIALGTAGVVLSDHLWYFAGALRADRFLLRGYCRLTGDAHDCEGRAHDWLTRYGPLVIVVGRFVAAVRMLAWPLARSHGVSYPVFLALDVTAGAAWCATWVLLGWILGERWAEASDQARWIGGAVAGAAVLALVMAALWRRRRRPAVPRTAG